MRYPGAAARVRRASQSAGRATRSVLSASRSAARAGAAAGRGTAQAMHRLASASGAGRTGLAHLIESSAGGSAGDGFVAVALAGTLFFSASVTQARGRVALALIVTMAPFALLAPFVGPFLDRVRRGRRYVLAGTMLARGLLCWGMAGAVQHADSLTLLPAAFGVLLLQKAYGVTRASVTPRLLPGEITLVTANSRCALASLIATTVAVPVAAGFDAITGGGATGAAWVLRAGTIIYLAAMVPGLRLPDDVDEIGQEAGRAGAAGEAAGGAAGPGATGPGATGRPGRPHAAAAPRWRLFPQPVGPAVAEAIRANVTLRAYSGFMIFFLAFLLRTVHLGVPDRLAVGAMLAAVAVGGFAGTAIGAALRARAPQLMVFAMLGFTTVATAAGAALFGLWAAVMVAFSAALGQTLVKLALDSIVQREVGARVRSSTFAASETLHQLSWVAGGLLGLAMSFSGSGVAGLAVAATCLALSLGSMLITRRRRILRARDPARSGVDVVGHRA